MHSWFFSGFYILISLLIEIVTLVFAGKSLKKPTKKGRYLGYACLGAAAVVASYLISILIKDRFWFSVMSSVYFICIDLMLVSLYMFTIYFVKQKMTKWSRMILVAIGGYLVFDIVVLSLNPFFQNAIRFVERNTVLAKYSYQILPLYGAHLAYTYLLVFFVLILLCVKICRVPSDYKRQYLYAVLGILTVVCINAVFLFLPGSSLYNFLDYSIWCYSFVIFFLYWNCFDYSTHGMLNHFRNRIFENIDQGIVLFDYENQMILKNQRAEILLSEHSLKENMKLDDFLKQCNMTDIPNISGESCSLQCFMRQEEQLVPVRCDYRLLKNKKEEILGRLFVFSDSFENTDVLTGFQNWDSFRRKVKEKALTFRYPLVIGICDINGLSIINKKFGRSKGDQILHELADSMRKCFPRDTYFVRGENAELIAICYETIEDTILNCMHQTEKMSGIDIQYAASNAQKEGDNLLDIIFAAEHGMKMKKMLNKQSEHSDQLTSLVSALHECDSGTEEHVQRTQKMGYMLGKRIGLSDLQLSDLSLLCLLHDIGKIGIPLEILNKPGKLSNSEWNVLKTHVEKGYQIAGSSQELKGISEMIRFHHERWDGTGYPDGRKGEEIPLLSRIIAVVDAYDAIVSTRPYRQARSMQEAKDELLRCSGTQFDPTIVSEFIKMLEEKPEEFTRHKRKETEEKNPFLSLQKEEFSEYEAQESVVAPVLYSRYLLNEEQNIIAVDDNFEVFTGYSREEVLERPFSQIDLLFPEEKDDYMRMVVEYAQKNPIIYLRHRIRRKDGSSIKVNCYGKRYFDSADREGRSEIVITEHP